MKRINFSLSNPAWELFDQITLYVLKDAYRTSKTKALNTQCGDMEYNKRLRAAIEVVLEYYGEKP